VFGTIVKGSGSGTVQVDANAGQRNVGGVFGLSSPAPSNASYTVTGEGGQTISVSVPTAMTISGPGGYSLNVDLSSTASGARNLSSAIGSAGSYSFTMGGTLYVPSGANTGAYTGSYSVTVQYN
jgi:hypothetical protein